MSVAEPSTRETGIRSFARVASAKRMRGMNRCGCGSDTFIRVLPVAGLWVEILTVRDDGTVKTEGCGDGIRSLKQPKTIRCDGCGKRHPNPEFAEKEE